MDTTNEELVPKFDAHEQDLRYIESRQIETGVLGMLEDLFQEMIGRNREESLTFHSNQLDHNLRRWFNSWQFFYDGKRALIVEG